MDAKRTGLLVLCLGLGVAFWNQPWLWPLKLLAVMVHESSHAAATWIAGGRVQRIVISANEAGACLSALPFGFWRQVLVYSAGYVGSALVGGLWVLMTLRWGWGRFVLAGLATWLGAAAFGFAGNSFTLFFCLVMAVVLAAIARWAPAPLTSGVALFISAFTGLYALFDLRDDLWNGAVRDMSDAGLLARMTWIPAFVWAVLWSAASIALLLALSWRALAPRAHAVRHK